MSKGKIFDIVARGCWIDLPIQVFDDELDLVGVKTIQLKSLIQSTRTLRFFSLHVLLTLGG